MKVFGLPWQGLKENKEIFHLSLNMGAYVVAGAHKQCEAGTVAHFQSGFVAKTQTESLPGDGQGLLKPAEVLRVPLKVCV